MGKHKTDIIIVLVIIAVTAGGIFYFINKQNAPSKYDSLAQCIKDKGAIFYGAFWCSHCQNQKKMFGTAQKYLPYTECSTPDGQGQLDVCREKGIEGYPTWEFVDGSRQSGEINPEDLAAKTSCPMP